MRQVDVLVIGGGAAGFFAAIQAGLKHPEKRILILEATQKTLTKVKISGGGRCNATHACFEPTDLIKAYPRGAKELRGAFHRFQPRDTIEFFRSRGVELKVEKDGRMFPTTNQSQTIIRCFEDACEELGVMIQLGQRVEKVERLDSSPGFSVTTKTGEDYQTRYLIVATGSSPWGHRLAEQLGHRIVEPVPSIFTFKIQHPLINGLAGTSFEQVELELTVGKKRFRQTGPMLITHWGLSGPAILKLSAFAARDLHAAKYQAELKINWLDASHAETLTSLKQFKAGLEISARSSKKPLSNPFPSQLTKRFWQNLYQLQTDQMNSPEALPGQDPLPKKLLDPLTQCLTRTKLQVTGKGVFKEEFVTAGGVSRKEIDFRSFGSKIVPGLYFSGEVIDIDGMTGGFNFQNAWTGSYLCAQDLFCRQG